MIKKDFMATVSIEPFQVADMFWQMDDEGQAMFFNRLGVIATHKLCMQMAYVSQHEALNVGGKMALETIAEYGKDLQ